MKRVFLMLCVAGLLAACSQKQTEVSMPASKLNLEELINGIDYDMDISELSLSDVHVLANAPAALKGYPFEDSYLRGAYQATTWYDSLTWVFDDSINYDGIEPMEDEDERSHYHRAAVKSGLLNFTDEEQAFMKRLQEREQELLKKNFDVPDGWRVNVHNLLNPNQLNDIDSVLLAHLAQDGFAIVPANHDQLFHVYEQNDYGIFPSFITTDLYLQLFHLYIDCTLRELEEEKLHGLMVDLSREMYETLHMQAISATSDEIKELSQYDAIFFAIGYELLSGKAIGSPAERAIAGKEVEAVMKSENAFSDFIEEYKNVEFAYSLFRPRGHYTRSETLKRYFRGMMWLQSVPFGLENDADLKRAIVMADVMSQLDDTQKNYDTLNHLITFLMGQSDNLSIPQVQAELKKTGKPVDALLADKSALQQLRKTLDEIGNNQTRIRPKFENTSHNKVCFMPQRYQPDAEVLQEMVDYESRPTTRATPKGLDFFAAMGVGAAEQILVEEGQKWKDFKPMLTKMKGRMEEIDWNETICTQWMKTLKVISEKSDGLPYFMVTPEWDKKNLNAMLASWAELKHDAILYAKQPFGAECGGGGLPEPVTKGYVEPNVGFWKKAIELLDNTSKLLKQQNMLTQRVEGITQRMREEAEFFLNISEKEIQGKKVTNEEYDHIKYVGANVENISLDLLRDSHTELYDWSDLQGADRKVALVADVYTANSNNNPEQSILFEAVGLADEIYVIVEIEGYLYLTRGAVFSYREFIRPLNEQRLTDEEWQKELETNPRQGVPEWMKRILVPTKEMPQMNEKYFYSSGC